jgi:hypothetical protein
VALNPDPTVLDTAFTIVRRKAIAQSAFYTPGPVDPTGAAYPPPYSAARTLGVRSNYDPAIVLVSTLPGTSSYTIEYQGAFALDPTSNRRRPDLLQPTTPWTSDINACDGFPYLRWRLTLLTDVGGRGAPVIDAVVIPVRDSAP